MKFVVLFAPTREQSEAPYLIELGIADREERGEEKKECVPERFFLSNKIQDGDYRSEIYG